jgi:6-phosphogluconolactonase
MYKPEIQVFSNIQAIASRIIEDLLALALEVEKKGTKLNIALSGGNTPKIIYQALVQKPVKNKIPWRVVHFYWGDERCVGPGHPDSNYGMALNHLIKHIPVPPENIHRIQGENDPEIEINRYAQEIDKNISRKVGMIPQFDWILLGLGKDGHTASLFHGQKMIKEEKEICACTLAPVTGHQRITLTEKIINQAVCITFLVSGRSKAEILNKVLGQNAEKSSYPAARIKPEEGRLRWYIDSPAACKLNYEFLN